MIASMLSRSVEGQQHKMETVSPATVLIVDDKPANRAFLRRILQPHHHILLADGGHAALDILQRQPVDLVLADMLMAGMNGLGLLHRIRQMEDGRHVGVVLIASMSDNDTIAQGFYMGANDFISRPINPTILQARVDAQIASKRLRDEREQVIRRLEQTQAAQSRLMKMALHDLRHPMTNIRIAGDMLDDYVTTNPESRPILQGLVESVDNMGEIFEDFVNALTVSGHTLNLEVLDVQRVVDTVFLQYYFAATKKHIALEQADMRGAIYADATRLEQALGNLLSNAIKYSPPHSVVRVSASQQDGRTTISVADEGAGVPVAERDQLFTEFGSLSNQPTGDEPSVGLGLWIVRQVVEAMGGEVGAEFPPDGGSVFWLSLPADA